MGTIIERFNFLEIKVIDRLIYPLIPKQKTAHIFKYEELENKMSTVEKLTLLAFQWCLF